MPTRSRARRIAAAAFCGASMLVSACASAHAPDPFQGSAAPRRGLEITVVNDNVVDMRIYLLRGSVPIPIGSVGSAERRGFRISPAELGSIGGIRLKADPLAGLGQPYVSEVIQVAPGQHLEWHLAHRLALSSVTVR